jgi:hypothetical protein
LLSVFIFQRTDGLLTIEYTISDAIGLLSQLRKGA